MSINSNYVYFFSMAGEQLRGSEIDRFLFDVTDSMADDSEDGGDSDADDCKLSVSHNSYTRDSLSVSPATNLFCNKSSSRQQHADASTSLPSTSNQGQGLSQRDIDYIFESDDSLADPTFIPSPQQNIEEDVQQLENDLYLSSSESEPESDDQTLIQSNFIFDKTPSNPNLYNSFIFNQPIGPKVPVNIASPLSIFLFFIGNFLDTILVQSNLYANQQNVDLKLERDELLAFFGILIVMGFHSLPSIRLYWSTDRMFHVEAISKVMSLKRFLKILRYLHVNDNTKAIQRGQPGYDKLFKIRPFIDHLKNTFSEGVSPSRFLSIDESMIGFKGRSSLKQYLPLKPIKRGFKVWAICCAVTGYLVCLDVYEGKHNTPVNRRKEDTLGSSVVIQLCKAFETLGYCIFFDRFFTTIPLIKQLLNKGLFGCGTIQRNRKHLPNNLLKSDKTKKTGDYDSVSSGDLSVSKWKDRGKTSVMVVSSMHCTSEEAEVQRRNKTGEKVTIQCPKAIADYNKYMGGVDHFDQLLSTYSISQKSKRWWVKIFYYLLDTAFVNSFILYSYVQKKCYYS